MIDLQKYLLLDIINIINLYIGEDYRNFYSRTYFKKYKHTIVNPDSFTQMNINNNILKRTIGIIHTKIQIQI